MTLLWWAWHFGLLVVVVPVLWCVIRWDEPRDPEDDAEQIASNAEWYATYGRGR